MHEMQGTIYPNGQSKKRVWIKQQKKINQLLSATPKPVHSTKITNAKQSVIQHPPCHQLQKKSEDQHVLSSKELWAHQFKVRDVLESLLKATKGGDNLFIAMMQNPNLTVSKTEFINGLATNNNKIDSKLPERCNHS